MERYDGTSGFVVGAGCGGGASSVRERFRALGGLRGCSWSTRSRSTDADEDPKRSDVSGLLTCGPVITAPARITVFVIWLGKLFPRMSIEGEE